MDVGRGNLLIMIQRYGEGYSEILHHVPRAEMKRVHFDDAERFQDAVCRHLVQHEAENNLILGILANILSGDYKKIDPYMAVIEDRGKIHQVLLRTPPFPVLISYRQGSPPRQVKRLAVEGLQSLYGHEIGGMTGDKEIIGEYARTWARITGLRPELKTAMRIYRLQEVDPVTDVRGTLRPAAETDWRTIKAWFSAFQREALGEEVDEDRLDRTLRHYLTGDRKHRGLVIWEAKGEPVSMAGYSGPTPNGIRINAVYTPPDLRRNGYASACVGELSQRLLDQHYRFCFLFTDLENPTSNHIYQEIGYEAVSDVNKVIFKPGGEE